jgi:hypothetical protein
LQHRRCGAIAALLVAILWLLLHCITCITCIELSRLIARWCASVPRSQWRPAIADETCSKCHRFQNTSGASLPMVHAPLLQPSGSVRVKVLSGALSSISSGKRVPPDQPATRRASNSSSNMSSYNCPPPLATRGDSWETPTGGGSSSSQSTTQSRLPACGTRPTPSHSSGRGRIGSSFGRTLPGATGMMTADSLDVPPTTMPAVLRTRGVLSPAARLQGAMYAFHVTGMLLCNRCALHVTGLVVCGRSGCGGVCVCVCVLFGWR